MAERSASTPPQTRLIDCFTFANELDMLEKRLELLDAHVDAFVIVEGTRTYSGRCKPLHFARHRNEQRFARYAGKIEHVIVDHAALGYSDEDNWRREGHQRDQIAVGVTRLKPTLSDEDVVLIGDADELPSPEALKAFRSGAVPLPATCQMRFFYYSLRWEKLRPWFGTTACRWQDLRRSSPQSMRETRGRWPSLPEGGWHLSYFGDAGAIATKIQSFAHQELNRPEFTDPAKIAERIRGGRDCFDRGGAEDLREHALPPGGVPPVLLSYFP